MTASLTTTINELEHLPQRLGDLGWFSEEGITTTSIMVEKVGSLLRLVPAQPRGSDAKHIQTTDKRKLVSFGAQHLPQWATVMADEVQNVRSFGQETQVETLEAVLRKHLIKMRRDLDATLEWQRIGAVKGQVLDADGTTVLNDIHSAFGLTKTTANLPAAAGTGMREKIMAFKRTSEDELGAFSGSGYRVLCGDDFFDALTGNPEIDAAYDRWQESVFLRDDVRAGFSYGGKDVIWENYRGTVNGQKFIADDKAYWVPEGVPGLFEMKFAPADYAETVNTLGIPMYAKQERMRFDKGLDMEAQSNPIALCTRPTSIIELTAT